MRVVPFYRIDAVKDPERRMRFGLDSEGFSATKGDCTRWVLQRHNHLIHSDIIFLKEKESLNRFLVWVDVNICESYHVGCISC